MKRRFDDPTLGGALRPRGPIQFDLTMRLEAGATVIAVTGEVDALTAPRLSTHLDDVVRRHTGDVVIDLADAGFIDSLGLHALLKIQRRLSRQRRSLTVICGQGPVRTAIELARLADALDLVPSLDEYLRRRSPCSG